MSGSKDLGNASVLVTGGAGFIGSHTVEALLAAGVARVTVLDNLSAGKRERLPESPRLRFVRGDIRSQEDVQAALDGVTHVVHLAAQVSVPLSIENPAYSADNNVAGFLNVLDYARHAGVERLVYASSAAVYGDPVQLPLDEQAPTRPMSPYGLEKLIDDQYADLYRRLHGLSSMGLRYFNVYGPGQDPASSYSGVISKFLEAIAAGRALTVYGDGGQTRDFVYVKDVARVNVQALFSGQTGVCNVATAESISLLQVIEILSRLCGHAVPVDFLPAKAGDIRYSSTLTGCLRQLFPGFQPTRFEAGMAALVKP